MGDELVVENPCHNCVSEESLATAYIPAQPIPPLMFCCKPAYFLILSSIFISSNLKFGSEV